MFGQTTNRQALTAVRCFLSVMTADNIAFERRRQHIMFCLVIGHLAISIFAERLLYVCATVQEVIYGKKMSSVILKLNFLIERLIT